MSSLSITSSTSTSSAFSEYSRKHLSNITITHIHSYLSVPDLAICCSVNHKWKSLASKQTIWNNLLPQLQEIIPAGMSVQKYLGKHGIKSKELIVKRFEKFYEKLPRNTIMSLICWFLLNPGCKIMTKCYSMDYGKKAKRNFAIDEHCVLVEKLPNSLSEEEKYQYNGGFLEDFWNKTGANRYIARITSYLPEDTDEDFIKNSALTDDLFQIMRTRVDQLIAEEKRQKFIQKTLVVIAVVGVVLYCIRLCFVP